MLVVFLLVYGLCLYFLCVCVFACLWFVLCACVFVCDVFQLVVYCACDLVCDVVRLFVFFFVIACFLCVLRCVFGLSVMHCVFCCMCFVCFRAVVCTFERLLKRVCVFSL